MYKLIKANKKLISFFILFVILIVTLLFISFLPSSKCGDTLSEFLIDNPNQKNIIAKDLNLIPEIQNINCIGKILNMQSTNNNKDVFVGTNDTVYFFIIFINPFFFILCSKVLSIKNNLSLLINLVFILVIEYVFNFRIGYSFFSYNLFVYPLLVFLTYQTVLGKNE